MFSGKDAGSYPTQWALNPTAYQNIDASQVDWAALAQQWMAMKEAAAIIAAPPPPTVKPDTEEGEAPMEVENPETAPDGQNSNSDWETAGNSWGDSWNQWGGWGWPNSGGVDSKLAPDPSIPMAPIPDGYTGPASNSSTVPGYTSNNAAAPTFQHGYWTAPPVDQPSSRDSSSSRDKNSKSRNRERPSRNQRIPREKIPLLPIIEPVVTPAIPIMDAAKRRQLPAWIREGLEKMEREKQRAIEREEEKKALEEAEKEKKRLEEEELQRMKTAASGAPMPPPKSKFESDSEGEEDSKTEAKPVPNIVADVPVEVKEEIVENEPFIKKSPEEIMREIMLAVRRSLTEILLEVTDQEIHTVSQEEFARYSTAQASRLNAMKASKSKALAAISSGLGLGAYESSSEESADEDEQSDLSDQQLQEIIRRKKLEFERTSREIEAEVRRAEQREAGEGTTTPISATPEKPRLSRSSETPPPIETPEKLVNRRVSKDKRNDHKNSDRVDGVRKLETIPEERSRKSSKRIRTPSPQTFSKIQEDSSSSSSDSDDSSSSSSSSSSSESEEPTLETKKRKRKSSSSEESRKKSKRSKEKQRLDEKDYYTKSRQESYEKAEKSKTKKKDDYYEKGHKSSKRRETEKWRKEKYREDSEERYRKRAKRSRSISYESRSGRKRASRDRSSEKSKRREKRSYDRESSRRDRSYDRSGRDYEKYDRYERSRDYDRKRSRSHSRHRR